MTNNQKTLVVFGATLAVYHHYMAPLTMLGNTHQAIASAWLHGRLDLDPTINRINEMVEVNGKYWSFHAPLGAVTYLPWVYWYGVANPVPESILVGAVAVAAAYRLTSNYWLAAFLALGTPFCREALVGWEWGYALNLACMFTLFALQTKNPWLAATWVLLAAFSRWDMVLVIPIYWLITRDKSFIIALLVWVVIYYGYNLARFGTFHDPTLLRWYMLDPNKSGHGPFSLYNLPRSLYIALFEGPQFFDKFPWLRIQTSGQSLLLTSPALLLAFREKFRIWWLAILVSMTPCLLVWSPGYIQFGARYWILSLPFFLVLMNKGPTDRLAKALIIMSIVFCLYGLFTIRVWGFV